MTPFPNRCKCLTTSNHRWLATPITDASCIRIIMGQRPMAQVHVYRDWCDGVPTTCTHNISKMMMGRRRARLQAPQHVLILFP